MENLTLGLAVAVIGVVIVLIVLAILSGILSSLKFITIFAERGAKKASAAKPPEPTAEAVSEASANEITAGETDEIPLELIAVITAAIAAETGVSQDGFIVRSIRRVNSWNETSRREQQRRLY